MVGHVRQQSETYPLNAIDIPAHTVTELKSGSYYIRLVDHKRQLANGSTFDLTFEFQYNGKRMVKIFIGNL